MERALSEGHATLEDERTTFKSYVARERREQAAGRDALERDWAALKLSAAPTAARVGAPAVSPDLKCRRAELDAYAKHLLQTRESLRQQEDELMRAQKQFRGERAGADEYDRKQAEKYEQWRQEQETAASEYEWRREALAKEMAELREQRSQVVRMLGELRETRRRPHGAKV